MKVKSFKSLLIVGLCVWGATGALAFWAGKKYSVNNSAAATAKGRTGKRDAKGNLISGALTIASVRDPGAPSAEDLLRAKGKMDPAMLARWAASLSAGDMAKTLDELKNQPAGAKRDAMLGALYDSWAKQDPKAFLAQAAKISSPKARDASTLTALTSWANQDPKSALDWLKQNPGATAALNTQQYNAIISGYAMSNPAEAFNLVNTMPDGARNNSPESQAKLSAFNALIAGLGQQGNFNDAVQMINQVQNAQMKNQAYNSLMSQWAVDSPQDAANFVATLDASTTNPRQKQQYNSMIAQQWAQTDPAAAAAWAAQTDAASLAANANGAAGPGGARGGRGGNNSLLASTVGTWVSEGGVDDAGQFLNGLPASQTKDQAIAAFAIPASAQNFTDTLPWINSISDPALRTRTLNLATASLAQNDPAGFNQYLSTLDPATAQQVQQSALRYNGGGGGFAGGGNVVNGAQVLINGGGAQPGGRRGGQGGQVITSGATGGYNGGGGGATVITNGGGGRGGRRGGGGGG